VPRACRNACRAAVAVALVAALAFPAAASAAPPMMAAIGATPPQVQLPRDHFGHPRAGIEWWYFTALAKDAAGTPYTVFFTLFSSRGGLVADSQVVNLATGAVVGHTEDVALRKVSSSSLDARAGPARLRFLPRTNTWSFSVLTPAFAVSLTQRPLKPYALHGGGTGVIQQSVAGPSHYYSSTRMSARGTLRAGSTTVTLTGQSWFDHQWGNFVDDPRAFDWDWFSCRFLDGSELMLYRFRDAVTGLPIAGSASGTFVAKSGKATAVKDFAATAGARTLDAEGRSWPLDWTLEVPPLSLTESLAAIVPDQLVRNKVVPTFWEGASTATGTRAGTCFVELSYR
jgi:predicted secreted hydrolase